MGPPASASSSLAKGRQSVLPLDFPKATQVELAEELMMEQSIG
jgi:hypothetical protein